ncbi:MAG: hypothetical protein GY729_22100 [Desulfobacteraceae bacterium]|nr:hypothetical protein [Desulfobacteraceae bacterium]
MEIQCITAKRNCFKKDDAPNNKSIPQISQEEVIPESTLYAWRSKARDAGVLLRLRYLNIVVKKDYIQNKFKIGKPHVRKQMTGTNTAANNLNMPSKKNDKKISNLPGSFLAKRKL